MYRAIPVTLAAVLAVPAFVRAEAPLRAPTNVRKAPSMLDRTVGQVNLDKVTLADAIDFLRDSAGVNLHVNWKALESAGVSRDVPVSIRLSNLPVRKALTYVLNAAPPATWFLDDGVIEVTTQELADKHMYTRVYPIDDLVMDIPDFYGPQFNLQSAAQGSGQSGGGQSPFQNSNTQQQPQQQPRPTRDERGQQIVDLVTQSIRPDIWKVNGGPATIAYYHGSLVVTAPRQVHEAIAGR
jgi:hypothetical protein